VTDSFCRCSYSGQSEALLIGGISGIGKSRLVNTLVPMVRLCGIVVRKKFDVLLSNPSSMGFVISAFNDLFVKIKRTATPAEMGKVHTKLASIFGSSFGYVKQVLPNISLLLGSQQSTITAKSQEDSAMKNSSIAYILQQVLKVVSSKETPVMMFFVSSMFGLVTFFVCSTLNSSWLVYNISQPTIRMTYNGPIKSLVMSSQTFYLSTVQAVSYLLEPIEVMR